MTDDSIPDSESKANGPGNTNQTTSGTHDAAAVSARLLERLICPVSRGPLTYDQDNNTLISPRAGLVYPIRDGIPIMLEDEAETLTN